MHRVYGSRCKVVWLPTFEADKHVKTLSKPDAVGRKRTRRSSRARTSSSGPDAPLPFLKQWVSAKHVAQAAKELGAKSLLISANLGQSGNMVHPDRGGNRRDEAGGNLGRRHQHDVAQEPGQAARS